MFLKKKRRRRSWYFVWRLGLFKKEFSILTRHLSLFKVIPTTLKREHADNLWSKCRLTTHRIGQTYITCQSYTEKLREKITVQRMNLYSCHFSLCAEYATRELEKNQNTSLNRKLTMNTLTNMCKSLFQFIWKK